MSTSSSSKLENSTATEAPDGRTAQLESVREMLSMNPTRNDSKQNGKEVSYVKKDLLKFFDLWLISDSEI